MGKAANIRKRRGQYQVRTRTKPTTGYVGPREAGPHGVTNVGRRVGWRALLFGNTKGGKL